MRQHAVELLYLGAASLFILALMWMSHPSSARRSVQAGEAGMLLAIVGTLIGHDVIHYDIILIAMLVGSAIGAPMAYLMPMTAIPQRTAISHAFGALAIGLIGTAEYFRMASTAGPMNFVMFALMFELLLGLLTFTASLLAFAKLQELMTTRPIMFKGQNLINMLVFLLALASAGILIYAPQTTAVFPVFVTLALLFGVLLIIPIGGADMPTVIALLNAYAGLSASAMGFALNNKLLIITGALDGSSGFILAVIMCKAMNRSFANVLFGGFGQLQSVAGHQEKRPVRSAHADEAAMILEAAQSVVIIPGYGMAVAQAQHKVAELYEQLTRRGIDVRFAIHPVAGRMPGHMNVLLAEADVAYDRMIEMEDINPEMPITDVALIIGANDTVNPAARDDPKSPIAGMPIIEADKAKTVLIIKRSMSAGFAGIDNDLYYLDKTQMLFGDAKSFVSEMVKELAAE